VCEGNSDSEEWRETDNNSGSNNGAKQKPKQAVTKAMKQWYFEQCKKKKEKKFINHWRRGKKVDRNELTMAREDNEARRRREEHQSIKREKT